MLHPRTSEPNSVHISPKPNPQLRTCTIVNHSGFGFPTQSMTRTTVINAHENMKSSGYHLRFAASLRSLTCVSASDATSVYLRIASQRTVPRVGG